MDLLKRSGSRIIGWLAKLIFLFPFKTPTTKLIKEQDTIHSIRIFVDSVKLLITLASAFIAFIIAFIGEYIIQFGINGLLIALVILICLLASILAGVLTVYRLSGMLDPFKGTGPTTVYDKVARTFSCWQLIFFGISLLFAILMFGIGTGVIIHRTQSKEYIMQTTLDSAKLQATTNFELTLLFSPSATFTPSPTSTSTSVSSSTATP